MKQTKIFEQNKNEIIFTRCFPEEMREHTRERIDYILDFFPELDGETIKVGKTRSGGQYIYDISSKNDFEYIRLDPSVRLYTIAHELTHALQWRNEDIPHGERSCDIWTLARSSEYIDITSRIGTYVTIPNRMVENIDDWKEIISEVAKDAIKKREQGKRQYIVWFEEKLQELAQEAIRKENERFEWMNDLWKAKKEMRA